MTLSQEQKRTEVLDRRLEARRARAFSGAKAAISALSKLGVKVELVGSLKAGRFGYSSDVDLLVTECPRSLKYAIEAVVEDCLPGLSFDVLYLEDMSPRRADLHREAVGALRDQH